MTSFIFPFLLGVFSTLYFIITYTRGKEKNKEKSQDEPIFKFYINLFLVNTKDIVENIVRSKISRRTPILRAISKRIAVRLVKDEVLGKKIGVELCKELPNKFSKMGLNGTAWIVFQQSSYVCIEVKLISLSVKKFFAYQGPQALQLYEKLDQFFYWTPFEQWLENLLATIIGNRLLGSIADTVIDKLFFKLSSEVEVVVCTEAEQGPFLLDTIQEIKKSTDKEESKELTEKQK